MIVMILMVPMMMRWILTQRCKCQIENINIVFESACNII